MDLTFRSTWLLLKETFREWTRDKAPRLGAALAYYTIFSIAPLFLIAIAIAGAVFGQDAARGEIFGQLEKPLGPVGAKAIEELIKNANRSASGSTAAAIIGGLTLIFGATAVFSQLKDALNTIWNVESTEAGGVAGYVRNRLLSFGMVLGIGFLLLVSLILTTVVAAAGKFMKGRIPGNEALWQAVTFVTEVAVVTLLFAMLFKFLPDIQIRWRDVWLGAAFTALLFTVGKLAVGFYLGRGTIGSAYGAAGSFVVLLLWIYYSTLIFFFGAEFTQVFVRTAAADSPAAMRSARKWRPKEQSSVAPPAVAEPRRVQRQKSHGVLIGVGSGCLGLLAGMLLGVAGIAKLTVGTIRKLL